MTRLEVKLEPMAANRLPQARVTDAEVDFDRRWANWLATGRRHDVRVRRRMGQIAWIIGGGIVLWLAWALLPSLVFAAALA